MTAISEKAFPLADEELTKFVLEIVTHAATAGALKQSVKDVVASVVRERAKLVVLAANHAPIDSLLHIPLLCEEKSIPYVFVESRELLSRYARLDNPTSAVVIVADQPKLNDNIRIRTAAAMIERIMI